MDPRSVGKKMNGIKEVAELDALLYPPKQTSSMNSWNAPL